MAIKHLFKKTKRKKVAVSETSAQITLFGKKQIQRLAEKGISIQLFVST